MLESYRKHVEERAAEGIPPLPLNAEQMAELAELLKNPPPVKRSFCSILSPTGFPLGLTRRLKLKLLS